MRVQVEGCCCCFSLETGVKIIGYLELVAGVLCVIFGGTSLGGDVLAATVTSVQGGELIAIYSLMNLCINQHWHVLQL